MPRSRTIASASFGGMYSARRIDAAPSRRWRRLFHLQIGGLASARRWLQRPACRKRALTVSPSKTSGRRASASWASGGSRTGIPSNTSRSGVLTDARIDDRALPRICPLLAGMIDHPKPARATLGIMQGLGMEPQGTSRAISDRDIAMLAARAGRKRSPVSAR